jgi:adenosylhomocysteine nucleosidase
VSVTGFVAALTAEARTLGPLQPLPGSAAPGNPPIHRLSDGNLLVISGMGPQAAAAAAQALVAAGAAGLLSFGLAGALDPSLRAGAVLLPELVTDPAGQVHSTYDAWRERLVSRLGAGVHPEGGSLLSVMQPLTTTLTKSQSRAATGARAVDMESFAIANVAAASGLKFAVARVVVDTAADSLPRSVSLATGPRGEVAYLRLASGLVRRPSDLFGLLNLARRYRVAMRSLQYLAQRGLGLP